MSLYLKAFKTTFDTNDTLSKWWLLLLLLFCIYISITTVSCEVPTSAAYSNYRKLFVLPQMKLRPGEFKERPAHDRTAPVCQVWNSNPGQPASMSGAMDHSRARVVSGTEGPPVSPSLSLCPEPSPLALPRLLIPFSYQTVVLGDGVYSERDCDSFWGWLEFSSRG